MLQKTFATGILLSCIVQSYSQDITKLTDPPTPSTNNISPPEKVSGFTFTGSADVYYRYCFAGGKTNNLTSFTNSHNSFELGMASFKLEYKNSKVSLVTDFGFGKRATEFSYNDEGILAGIKQLYISYAPADWLKFTAGSFATHVGYELVDPHLNRNYSMSYMFTNGPFFHTGIKTDITKGKHGLMIGIANPTDYKSAPHGAINRKFIIAQYSVAVTDNTRLYINYVGGKFPDSTRSNQLDAVVTARLNNKFSMGGNATIASIQEWDGAKNSPGKSWWASALYLNFDPQAWLGFTLRGEYFNDEKQVKIFRRSMQGGNIFATTLSANFKINDLIIIPEVRIDNATENIFATRNGSPSSRSGNFLIAVVYPF